MTDELLADSSNTDSKHKVKNSVRRDYPEALGRGIRQHVRKPRHAIAITPDLGWTSLSPEEQFQFGLEKLAYAEATLSQLVYDAGADIARISAQGDRIDRLLADNRQQIASGFKGL